MDGSIVVGGSVKKIEQVRRNSPPPLFLTISLLYFIIFHTILCMALIRKRWMGEVNKLTNYIKQLIRIILPIYLRQNIHCCSFQISRSPSSASEPQLSNPSKTHWSFECDRRQVREEPDAQLQPGGNLGSHFVDSGWARGLKLCSHLGRIGRLPRPDRQLWTVV